MIKFIQAIICFGLFLCISPSSLGQELKKSFILEQIQNFQSKWQTVHAVGIRRKIEPISKVGKKETIELQIGPKKWKILKHKFVGSQKLVEKLTNVEVVSYFGQELRIATYKVADVRKSGANSGVRKRVDISLRNFGKYNPKNRLPLLFGHITGEENSLIEILKNGTDWKTKKVKIGGANCIQATVIHPNGEFRVSLDIDNDYAPVQIDVTKNGAHKHRGVRLSDGGVTSYKKTYSLRSVSENRKSFESLTESEMIVNGIQKKDQHIISWNIHKTNVKDDEIFVSTEIPNGTPVRLNEKKQIKAQWIEGKIVYPFDKEFVTELNKVKIVNNNNWSTQSYLLFTFSAFVVGIFFFFGIKRINAKSSEKGEGEE